MRKFTFISLAAVAMLLAAGCTPASGTLTGKTWQLTAITEKVPAFQGVVPEADQPRNAATRETSGQYNNRSTKSPDCPDAQLWQAIPARATIE